MILAGVFVPREVAEELGSLRRVVLDQLRRDGLPVDTLSAAAWAVLDDFARLAIAARQDRAAHVVTDVVSDNGPHVVTAQDATVTYVTVAEAAERAGVTRQAMDARIRRGTLRCKSDGRRRLVALEDL